MTAVFQDVWPMSLTRAKLRQDAAVESDVVDFDTVYREQRSRLLAIVRSVIGPSDELEDVLQLVFIEIHRCLPRFEGRSRLSTWLYRIAVNVALQYIRRKRRRRWLLLGPSNEEETHDQVATEGDSERAEDRQLLEKVQESVGKLSDKKRIVWQLHELQGMDPQEIADILDIPMNTVRSRLLAARRELMEDLEKRQVLPKRGQS